MIAAVRGRKASPAFSGQEQDLLQVEGGEVEDREDPGRPQHRRLATVSDADGRGEPHERRGAELHDHEGGEQRDPDREQAERLQRDPAVGCALTMA